MCMWQLTNIHYPHCVNTHHCYHMIASLMGSDELMHACLWLCHVSRCWWPVGLCLPVNNFKVNSQAIETSLQAAMSWQRHMLGTKIPHTQGYCHQASVRLHLCCYSCAICHTYTQGQPHNSTVHITAHHEIWVACYITTVLSACFVPIWHE